MIRDEKGRFTTENENNEMTDEQRDAICYKSKLLNKYFDKYEDMVAEEKAYNDAREAELKVKNERKEDAGKVEAAFKELNASKVVYNQIVNTAKQEYAAAMADAKAKYLTAIENASKHLEVKEKAYDDAFNEFKAKHPEGYHMTLRDGDNVLTVSESGNFKDFADIYKKLFDIFSF